MMIRTQFERAFTEYAEVHGRAKALADLEKATGARHMAAVADDKVLRGIAMMIGGGLALELDEPKKPADPERLAAMQNSLGEMAKKVYAPKEPPADA